MFSRGQGDTVDKSAGIRRENGFSSATDDEVVIYDMQYYLYKSAI